jgi:hypothetical protein
MVASTTLNGFAPAPLRAAAGFFDWASDREGMWSAATAASVQISKNRFIVVPPVFMWNAAAGRHDGAGL